MTSKILINKTSFETRVAIVEQSRLIEIHFERVKTHEEVTGNIYLGRVERVLPGMQAAFINIGLERTAFLHAQDLASTHTEQKPIEKLLFAGDRCMVQVIKDPVGNKGARLDTEISIAGRWLVYLPASDHIGISQKIADNERELLRERLKMLKPAQMLGGFIVRTAADHASDEELSRDMEYLFSQWQHIQQQAKTQSAPSLLYRDLSLSERVLRDMVAPHTDQIIVDDEILFQKLCNFCEHHEPEVVHKLVFYADKRGLFDVYSLDEQIKSLLDRKVLLPSGGYLMIDQTEAMTTIDVNTGSFVGKNAGGQQFRHFEDTLFKTNLEATEEVARQLKLRHLGGMILIDFIDMSQEQQREHILQHFKQLVQKDRHRITIHGFSHLGILEITRKRISESLQHVLCEPCLHCQGTGVLKTAQTVCFEIMREVSRQAYQFTPSRIEIQACEAVVDLFLDDYASSLAELEQTIQIPIQLKSNHSPTTNVYDVVLF